MKCSAVAERCLCSRAARVAPGHKLHAGRQIQRTTSHRRCSDDQMSPAAGLITSPRRGCKEHKFLIILAASPIHFLGRAGETQSLKLGRRPSRTQKPPRQKHCGSSSLRHCVPVSSTGTRDDGARPTLSSAHGSPTRPLAPRRQAAGLPLRGELPHPALGDDTHSAQGGSRKASTRRNDGQGSRAEPSTSLSY